MSETLPPTDALEQRERVLHKALRLLEADRDDLAAEELGKALARFPEDAELHFHLARALADVAPERARSEARAAIRLEPEWAPAHSLLGALQMDAGRHVDAEELLLESLRLDPQAAYTYELYGRLMFKTGHIEKAEKLLERALALDPELSSAHAILAVLLSEKGQRRDAKARGLRGVALEPEGAQEHFHLGVTYLETGHPFRARRHLREALRMEPSSRLEETFLQADRCCRVIYLPMYFYSRIVDRIPGRQFAVWAAFVALVFALPAIGASEMLVGLMVLSYILFCVYTWLAGPLVGLWVRVRPPR